MEFDKPETQESSTLHLLLKEFLFLKFKLRGNALVQEVESEKWKSQIRSRPVTQVLKALTLLETQTKQKFLETLAEKKTRRGENRRR